MATEVEIQGLNVSVTIKIPNSKKDNGGGIKRLSVKKTIQKETELEHMRKDGGRDSKRSSVERIYQKKALLEHILLQPDIYIGSVEAVTQPMWIWESDGMVRREITFVPGLCNIFDEILVNAADNKQRDPKMSKIMIKISPEKNVISVWNNGEGIPPVFHEEEKIYVPELIFGHLLTSNNEKKFTGGGNGYGAKLCNIFSTTFTVLSSSKKYRKKFLMTWRNNMQQAEKILFKPADEDYTIVTFTPDLDRFGMEKLDDDIVALLSRRAYDIAGTLKGVDVYLNGSRLHVNHFKEYVELYTKNLTDGDGNALKVVHEQVNPCWEVCLAPSDNGFQQLSFVNSVATTKGGRHVDHVIDQVVNKMAEIVKNKGGKSGIDVEPSQIKNHCWVFINCLIENPTFDSQRKENMTLAVRKFGSTCSLSEGFLKAACSSGIIDRTLNSVRSESKIAGAKSNRVQDFQTEDNEDAVSKVIKRSKSPVGEIEGSGIEPTQPKQGLSWTEMMDAQRQFPVAEKPKGAPKRKELVDIGASDEDIAGSSKSPKKQPKKTEAEKQVPAKVCLAPSDNGFQQLSFVNSVATTKGGRHVDHVIDQVVNKMAEIVKNKGGKSGIDVEPSQIKNHCWVFINCLIENPTFDSQRKENMTLAVRKFGSTCSLSEGFLKAACSSGIIDRTLNSVRSESKIAGAKSNRVQDFQTEDNEDAVSKVIKRSKSPVGEIEGSGIEPTQPKQGLSWTEMMDAQRQFPVAEKPKAAPKRKELVDIGASDEDIAGSSKSPKKQPKKTEADKQVPAKKEVEVTLNEEVWESAYDDNDEDKDNMESFKTDWDLWERLGKPWELCQQNHGFGYESGSDDMTP